MRYSYYFPYRRAIRANMIAQQNTEASAPVLPKPSKSAIKKKLKIVVDLSNTIQDENNKLQDMKDAWVPFRELQQQRLLIGDLCAQQYRAIKEMEQEESAFPDEKNNRFFYFKDKPIYWP